ncbi:hypothetical protein OIU46_01965 [Lacticaseibacillus paracasei]
MGQGKLKKKRSKIAMVERFYAELKQQAKGTITVDAFQALKLLNQGKLFTTPRERGTLFEFETGLRVHPVKGRKTKTDRGLPHFSYYPKEASPLKGTSNMVEWSDKLKVFIRAFEHIQKFQIETWGEPAVYIFPAKMQKLFLVKTPSGNFVLKFLVEIEETFPYSFAYLCNGCLGLEFTVSSQPTPIKKIMLAQVGIPIFQAKAQFPKWIPLPDAIETDQAFDRVAEEVQRTYEQRNYRLQGRFVNEPSILPKYQEKYNTLKKYEDQVDNLKKQLTALTSETETKEQLSKELDEQLKKYQGQNRYYQQLKDDSIALKDCIEKLTKTKAVLEKNAKDLTLANNQLKEENNQLKRTNQKLQRQIELPLSDQIRVKTAGFLKRIFKNW